MRVACPWTNINPLTSYARFTSNSSTRTALPPVFSPANPFPASPLLERLRFLCGGPWPSTLPISPATLRRPRLDCAGPPYTKRVRSLRAVPAFQRMRPLPLRTKIVRGLSSRSPQTFFASEARSLGRSLCRRFVLFESATRAGELTAPLDLPHSAAAVKTCNARAKSL